MNADTYPGLAEAHIEKLQAPSFKQPYDASDATGDINCMVYALEEFLSSDMQKSEQYLQRNDPRGERLYPSMGKALIETFKALLTWDKSNISSAYNVARSSNSRASHHRASTYFLPLLLVEYGWGPLGFRVKSMTDSERHAELVYAETMIFRALLGVVQSTSWYSLLVEVNHARLAYNCYLALEKYIHALDKVYQKKHPGSSRDPAVDKHFRSGVELGIGIGNLILSATPHRILALIKLVGYSGDRGTGIRFLTNMGGWNDKAGPSVSAADEGLRRPIADIALLVMHLIASILIFDGVSPTAAAGIVEWNSARFPNGPFYLMAEARLNLIRCSPLRAIPLYENAIESQQQIRQLHHACFWELATCKIALWDFKGALPFWQKLLDESNWSKCAFTYGTAITLLELGGSENEQAAIALLEKVPGLMQRIGGMFIPYEEILTDRAKSFKRYGKNRLILPILEFAYIFFMIPYFPSPVLAGQVVPAVRAARKTLEDEGQGSYPSWWDDWCLTRLLEGACLRSIAYPAQDAIIDEKDSLSISSKDAEADAEKAFHDVFKHGPEINQDHWIVYHAHFELGRLLTCKGDQTGARKQLDLVLSGKSLEVSRKLRKVTYSLELPLHVRANAALEPLNRK